MLNFSRYASSAAGTALLVLGICSTSALAAEKAAAPMPPAAGAQSAAPTPGSVTPGEATDPTPAVDMDKVVDDCKAGVRALGKGDAKALDSLAEEWRNALLAKPVATNSLTCLAIAENNATFCDALAKDAKNNCLEQQKLMGELKSVPKEKLKAQMIYKMCANDMPVADCEKVRDAMVARDGGKCTGLAKIDANFCVAMATGDASTCKALKDEGMRAVCSAYALDDPKHCPKESQDCRNLTEFMATAQKKGLAGVGDLDAGAVATGEGRASCATALGELEKSCGVR